MTDQSDIVVDTTPQAPARTGGPLYSFSLLVLGVAAALYAFAWAQTVWPDASGGIAFLSYGRLLPVATSLALYGGLTAMGLLTVGRITPRLVGATLARPIMVMGGVGLVIASSVAGSVAIALGGNTGGRLLEMPWWAEAGVLLGALSVAAAILGAVRSAETLPPAGWYLTTAPIWLIGAMALALIPELEGVPAAMRNWFVVTVLVGMWLTSVGIGLGYHLVSSRIPGVRLHPRLGVIGFWSIVFSWPWTAGRFLQSGPSPDWLSTIGVVFAFGVLLAVVTVAADIVYALRGRWDDAATEPGVRLWLLGFGFYVILVVHVLVTSLRGAGSVVHLTLFEAAFDDLVLFGPFAMWAVAATAGRDRGTTSWFAATSGVGIGAAVIARWAAGLQQGYGWAGLVNDGGAAAGDAFRIAVGPLEAWNVMVVVGVGLAAVALIGAALRSLSREMPAIVVVPGLPSTSTRAVVRGAIGLLVVTALAVFASPAIDAQPDQASRLAVESRNLEEGSFAAQGRDLYLSEGCWYCHTQQVRAVIPDVGLGLVSVPGDYVYDPGDLLGLTRLGPDLAHAGSRRPTSSAGFVFDHLSDPRAQRPWSTMPSYDYLTDAELSALASYITSLE